MFNFIIAAMLTLNIAHAESISTSNPELQKTYNDIRQTFGIVPTFF